MIRLLLITVLFALSTPSFAAPTLSSDCPPSGGTDLSADANWTCVYGGYNNVVVIRVIETATNLCKGYSINPADPVADCNAMIGKLRAPSATRCECRYTRVNNGWGEAELDYFPGANAKIQYFHQFFTPNISEAEMIRACAKANSDLVENGFCTEIRSKTCANGLADCDQ